MDNKLEKFIQTNRKILDVEDPPAFILENIQKELSKEAVNKNHQWIWKAASVTLLMISSVMLFLLLDKSEQEIASLQDLSPDHKQIENQYRESIEALSISIDLVKIDKKEFAWLFEELDYLESINNQFRKDINQKSNKVKLVSVLIDYYEKKLKILKRLELEINRRNHEKIIIDNS